LWKKPLELASELRHRLMNVVLEVERRTHPKFDDEEHRETKKLWKYIKEMEV